MLTRTQEVESEPLCSREHARALNIRYQFPDSKVKIGKVA